jgi:hypothetical protein
MFDIESNEFAPGRAGCVEYGAVAKAIINDVIEKEKIIHTLIALKRHIRKYST